ncbi:hypothetical protein SAMN02745857_03887 [Andreprevotia lacus DSM 23236]|jgi:hypothetical protein|uniref:Uncharacterized protein n=1 Tax=Andreprevotia lacus DSM 23236 TaxID=1121001 RepID=A0A1W1Y177_9NEIS|nr:hypothetical protein [Andreprevotia lacus]SMC29518.1 hypothetical protein SAMN02745857_03887 [Andreprevotia lacus DSM 23236]
MADGLSLDWASGLMGGLGGLAQGLSGGPSSAKSDVSGSLNPNLEGDWIVNFSGTQNATTGKRETGNGATSGLDGGGLGNTGLLLAGAGVLLLVLVMAWKRR